MTINLLDYFQTKVKANGENRIQAPSSPLGGPQVGTGQYLKLLKQNIDFQGALTKMARGPFSLSLSILDDKTCTMILNGSKQNGTYSKNGKKLKVVAGENTLSFHAGGGGTYIDGIPVKNGVKTNAWIGK